MVQRGPKTWVGAWVSQWTPHGRAGSPARPPCSGPAWRCPLHVFAPRPLACCCTCRADPGVRLTVPLTASAAPPARGAGTLGVAVSDLGPPAWWQRPGGSDETCAPEATLKAATTLVQAGVTGVTVILPRAPGVLARARLAASTAHVDVRADQIGSATITLRFSPEPAAGPRSPSAPQPTAPSSIRGRAGSIRGQARQWVRLLARARGGLRRVLA